MQRKSRARAPWSAVLAIAVLAPARAQQPAREASAGSAANSTALAWNSRNAEHLFNRAGFGARPAEIASAVREGQEKFVGELLAGLGEPGEPFFLDEPPRPSRRDAMGEDAFKKQIEEYRREERRVLFGYSGWWIDQMIAGKDPLREKMVLFWHGYFTSSVRDVKSTVAMVQQNQLFHRLALGNFRELIGFVVRDPAMIEYLDNNQNRRGNPNENLARELMELFTLGAGNYTEEDIKEAARALTGWRTNDDKSESAFVPRQHDGGSKTILGRTGRFDAKDLIDILLDQPACPRWLAGKLLVYFEGQVPSEARLAEYAALLKAQKYEIAPFLQHLFLDQRFYRDEIVGERISGPIEYLVGCTRRLGLDVPPQLLWLGAGQLGQRLFDPPNVKGWEGGEAWITTSSLLARGNMAGMLLGVVHMEDVLKDDDLAIDGEPTMSDSAMEGGNEGGNEGAKERGKERGAGDDAPGKRSKAERKQGKQELGGELSALKRLTGEFYYPRLNLTARLGRLDVSSDAQIVDKLSEELLPVALSSESRAALLEFLAGERKTLSIADGKLLDSHGKAEDVLRRLAHLILSLPEAQLG
jgi:uncharacterized protein (DUF1800 family)